MLTPGSVGGMGREMACRSYWDANAVITIARTLVVVKVIEFKSIMGGGDLGWLAVYLTALERGTNVVRSAERAAARVFRDGAVASVSY